MLRKICIKIIFWQYYNTLSDFRRKLIEFLFQMNLAQPQSRPKTFEGPLKISSNSFFIRSMVVKVSLLAE